MHARINCFVAVLLVCLGGLEAKADFFLYTHFSTTETLAPIPSASQIAGPPLDVAPGASVYAHFLLEITGTSTLYAYRFSVRFDGDLLDYVARREIRPGQLIADPNVPESGQEPTTQSAVSPLPLNFLELRRFDGYSEESGTDLGASQSLYHLGWIRFNVRSPLTGSTLLVLPGEFEQSPFPGDTRVLDAFLSDNGTADPKVTVNYFSNITAVPEPNSFALLSLAAAGVGMRRLRRLFRSN